jgi:hypothetical protein
VKNVEVAGGGSFFHQNSAIVGRLSVDGAGYKVRDCQLRITLTLLFYEERAGSAIGLAYIS